MKGYRLVLPLALLVIGLSWSSWIAFSTGFKATELSLELLGGVLDVFKVPLLDDSTADAPRFSVLPLAPGPPQDLNTGTATAAHTAGYNSSPFKEVYVVSLPTRSDRRIALERIRQVIPQLNWTYVDATTAEDTIVSRIMHHIEGNRSREPEQFSWPDNLPSPSQGPLGLTGADLWSSPSLSDANADLGPAREPLTCASQNYTRGPAYSPAIPPYMVLTRSKLACWHSHVQVLRRIAEGVPTQVETDPRSQEVALILEDDVDVERDLLDRVGGVWDALPPAWDMLYLGHCWSNESYHAPLASTGPEGRETSLHPSLAPKCTHAYAVTRAGARKLVEHLRYEPFAYSRALDQAYAWLVFSGRVASYSMVPSMVVQRKVSWSDIDEGTDGTGSAWRETLRNGVF